MSYEYSDSYDWEELIDTLNNQVSKISDLEAKLAELNKEPLNCSQLEKGMSLCIIQKSEIAKLKQQLAEKDKLLREKIGSLKTTDFIRLCLDCGFMVDAKDKDNQDKISFAVEQLEKVKEFVSISNKIFTEYYGAMERNVLIEQIDNQIKRLKEMK